MSEDEILSKVALVDPLADREFSAPSLERARMALQSQSTVVSPVKHRGGQYVWLASAAALAVLVGVLGLMLTRPGRTVVDVDTAAETPEVSTLAGPFATFPAQGSPEEVRAWFDARCASSWAPRGGVLAQWVSEQPGQQGCGWYVPMLLLFYNEGPAEVRRQVESAYGGHGIFEWLSIDCGGVEGPYSALMVGLADKGVLVEMRPIAAMSAASFENGIQKTSGIEVVSSPRFTEFDASGLRGSAAVSCANREIAVTVGGKTAVTVFAGS